MYGPLILVNSTLANSARIEDEIEAGGAVSGGGVAVADKQCERWNSPPPRTHAHLRSKTIKSCPCWKLWGSDDMLATATADSYLRCFVFFLFPKEVILLPVLFLVMDLPSACRMS